MTEQLNLLGNTIHEKGGLKELRRIQRDDTEPLPRREAAKILLRTMEDGFSKSGKPLAGDDLDRVWDRTVGKPLQSLQVTQQPPALDTLEAELRAMVAQDPTLPGRMRAMLANVSGPDTAALPAAIETTATPVD